MNREILFRGMRVDNGEWVYGDLVHDAISAYSTMMKVGIRQGGCYPDEVKPETVGQYTGLTDRNGVKIFEGDIVKEEGIKVDVSGGRENGVIVFETSWIEVKWSNVSSDSIGMFCNYGDKKPQLVVTGSIHTP